MYLENIHLHSFRNYQEQLVNFDGKKTILLGNNAQGKSNLLEAVELLSTLKSHRTNSDRDLVLEGETEARIYATNKRIYGQTDLGLIIPLQGRRIVKLNQENLRRNLDFLGVLNLVQFSSLDLDLVRGSPDYRRQWIDSLLIQLEPLYAYLLQQYNKVLRQRNALLKKESLDNLQLQLWNQQLATTGSRVTRRRARVIERLAPLAQKWHNSISGNTEILEIKYNPNVIWAEDDPNHVQQVFLAQLEKNHPLESRLRTTAVGPHRDDIELLINQTLAKSYGSQGQQRTLVLAIKLAELNLLEEVVGEPPLLLLDDVLAELDPLRQNQLLDAIDDRCQTLITTTHINSFDGQWLKSAQILNVEAGKIFESE